MSTEPTSLETCAACGASIYPEHLEQHTAERVAGQLLCSHCLKEKSGDSAAGTNAVSVASLGADSSKPAVKQKSKIREFNAGGIGDVGERSRSFRRDVLRDVPRATRIKTFHCKMIDSSIRHMDEQINEWIDEHDEVEVKFANSNIGVLEGLHSDPHLVITLFY